MESFAGVSADEIVNQGVQELAQGGNVSANEAASTIEENLDEAGVDKSHEAHKVVDTLRSFTHDVAIGKLPKGVGGLFNGSITVGLSTVEVGQDGCSETIARMQEVYDHEYYHLMHNHIAAMNTVDGADHVIIAGEGFTTTEIIEGLTVSETGNQFVSEEYRDHESRVENAIARAGKTKDDLRTAANEEHNLGLLDDRNVFALAP